MMNHCVWQLNILSFIVPVSPSCDARRPLLCGSGFMATWHLWGRLYFLPSFLKSQAVPEHLDPTFLSLQKDSHTLYLEQELDSLKVVLDIKNKQLHQQEKKMMEIDKLVRPEAHENDCRGIKTKKEPKKHLNLQSFCFFSLFFPDREKCEVGWEPEEGPAGEWGAQSSHGKTCCTVKVSSVFFPPTHIKWLKPDFEASNRLSLILPVL